MTRQEAGRYARQIRSLRGVWSTVVEPNKPRDGTYTVWIRFGYRDRHTMRVIHDIQDRLSLATLPADADAVVGTETPTH